MIFKSHNKKEHHMKKKIILLMLFVSLLLISCNKEKASQEPKNTDTIKTEKNLLSVEITLPSSLVGDDEVTLDEKAQSAGVTEITKNSDGSVTMKMTKEAHKKLLSELKVSIDENITEVLADKEGYPSFDSITYNNDVTVFTIKVDSAIYEELESIIALTFYFHGDIYQAFNAVPEEQLKTIVNFVDKDTGEVIESLDSSKFEAEENDVENQMIAEAPKTDAGNASIDMTGDYIGYIACPLPPLDTIYSISRLDDHCKCIFIHVTNIDNANFKFYITNATLVPGDNIYEDVIFLEHIAHYNGAGYYEYIGQEYHLYFKYNDLGMNASYKVLEVYGLDKLFIPSEYNETMQYNGITGNLFRQMSQGIK